MAHKKPETHKNIIKLCKDCSSCPSVEFGDDTVTLKDDFGGIVKLTPAQADMLGDEIARRKTKKART